jgi:hypothetical protein
MIGEIMKFKNILIILPVVYFLFIHPGSVMCQKPQDFVPLLIDLEGWEAGEAEVLDVSFQDFRGINVRREYERDDQSLDASIMIGFQAVGLWNPMYYDGFKMEAGGAIMDVKKTDGFFVFHNYQKSEKAGMCVVLLEETSQEKKTGAVFVFSYEGIEDSEGVELAKKFDWAKMKEIAKEIIL